MRAPSDTTILSAPPGRVYYGDGLCLKVTPTSRNWIFRYTSPLTRRPNETTIGPFPAFSYHDARNEIARMRQMLARDKDPVQEKRKERAKGTTFAQACEGWLKQHKSKWRSTRRLQTSIGKHAQAIAHREVRSIDKSMVVRALSPLWGEHPEQGYRTSTVWARVFDFAKAMNYRADDQANPAAWRGNLEHVFHRPKSEKHYASLPFQEVPEFMARLRLRQVKGNAAAALEFIALTASRPGEVLGMKWSEIKFHLVTATWTIPAERTKQGREHRIPLSPRCVELLAVQNEYRTSDFVFTGYKGGPIHSSTLHVLLKKMDMDARLDPHGFRRSFRNWAFRTRQDSDLAELALGHKITNKTQGAYLTEDGLEERRPIMQAWSAYCSPNR
jgi:integrase